MFGVLSNDSDPEGVPLAAQLLTSPSPSAGTLSLQADGSFTFTAQPAFAGAASFTYAASDGSKTSAAATVTLTVNADTDLDGLDDSWETSTFGSLATTPLADPDGDGFTNAEELVMGSNPLDGASSLRPSAHFLNATTLNVSFPSVVGRTYVVETSAGPVTSG